jgi:hypothetical protein
MPDSEVFCIFAQCPEPKCTGVVVPGAEPPERKKIDEASRMWSLQCPECKEPFKVGEFELTKGKLLRRTIRKYYPNFL